MPRCKFEANPRGGFSKTAGVEIFLRKVIEFRTFGWRRFVGYPARVGREVSGWNHPRSVFEVGESKFGLVAPNGAVIATVKSEYFFVVEKGWLSGAVELRADGGLKGRTGIERAHFWGGEEVGNFSKKKRLRAEKVDF